MIKTLLFAVALTLATSGCLTLFDGDLPPPPADDCASGCHCADGAPTGDACRPLDEQCNGLDDDLDGLIDEDPESLCGPTRGGRSTCLDGACVALCEPGQYDIDGLFSSGCEYACVPSSGGAEACDGADNDCDGVADEDLLGDRVPGLAGVCVGARRRCDGRAGWGEADVEAIDGFEVSETTCDGRDNDCDGIIDEGQPVGERCTSCDGSEAEPPCNGCPTGVVVPGGWVCIPPGAFMMGSEPEELWYDPLEAPRQPVQVTEPLLMMATEVTQAAWLDLAERNPARYAATSGDRCDDEAPTACPVERVSWFDAIWYANAASRRAGLPPCYDEGIVQACMGRPSGGCDAQEASCTGDFVCDGEVMLDAYDPDCMGVRLPSEAEWEYAARAGTAGHFWFPDDRFDQIAMLEWISDAGATRPRPVAVGAPNPWGLYDMLGNVHEWVHAWFVPYPNPPPSDDAPHRDRLGLRPTEPDDERVYRGGAWLQTAQFSRCAQRWSAPSAQRDSLIGVRFVRRVVAPDAE